MLFSLNKVQLIGHLGKDPEMRRTQDGRAIASFSVATSDEWRDKATGEKRSHTDWHNVVVFNQNLAKITEQYLKKGSLVFVEGKNQTRSWEDQSGTKRYTTEVVLTGFGGTLGMLSGARGDGAPRANDPTDYSRPSGSPSTSARQANAPVHDDMDDEIPF